MDNFYSLDDFLLVRDILLDKLYPEYLGEYTLSNGNTVPAIVVDPSHNGLPINTSVEGVEIVIIPWVTQSVRQLNQGYRLESETEVLVKQWDPSQNLLAVIPRLLHALPGLSRINPRILPTAEIVESQSLFYTTRILLTLGDPKYANTL